MALPKPSVCLQYMKHCKMKKVYKSTINCTLINNIKQIKVLKFVVPEVLPVEEI